MTEKDPAKSEIHNEGALEQQIPSDEELAEFERWRESRAYRPPLRIAEWARDPANPTEAELVAVADINSRRFPDGTSFEDYFGYPDPQEVVTSLPDEEPNADAPVRMPSDEELRAFEEWREPRAYRPLMRIEEFAKDPVNPTEAELTAVADINSRRFPPDASFEEYFGYPDPRQGGSTS